MAEPVIVELPKPKRKRREKGAAAKAPARILHGQDGRAAVELWIVRGDDFCFAMGLMSSSNGGRQSRSVDRGLAACCGGDFIVMVAFAKAPYRV